MSGVAAASKEAAELSFKLGQDQLAWAKEQFAANKGTTDKVVDSLLDAQNTQTKNSNELYQRYKDVYEPAQDRYLADAESYDTAGRRDMARGAAQAAVGQQFDAARDAATRNLESFGVNPASTRFAALDIGTRAQEAAAKAAAGNAADLQTEATGYGLRANAIAMGNGLPTQAIAAQGYQQQLDAAKLNNSSSSGWGSVLGAAAGIGAKIYGFADGGVVPEADATAGGAIPMGASPSHGAVTDDIPARLNAGEFVVPRDVVSWKGEEFMQKLILQSRQAKQGAVAKPAIGAAPQGNPKGNQAIPMRAAA